MAEVCFTVKKWVLLLADVHVYLISIYRQSLMRAAFKFGRRVHFALRRKMRKPPITRVPAILNGLTNRPS